MRRLLLLLLFAALHKTAGAQKLFYFLSADSLLGVKNAEGKLLIPAKYPFWMNPREPGAPVQDSVILFSASCKDQGFMSNSWGDAYNRSGELLYHPMAFDAGPDYFAEEKARCVRDHKVGFVNRKGEIVIRPQWDWVTPFEYGYAFACNGCALSYAHDAEHPEIVYPAGADTFYIDAKGSRIVPMLAAQQEKDQKVDNRYLPYPFLYTGEEQLLLDRINTCAELISQLYFTSHYPKVTGKAARLQFELTGRLKGQYIIEGYECREGHYTAASDMRFESDTSGHIWYAGAMDERQVLKRWLKKEAGRAKDFLRRYPDAPNKSDINAALKKIQALR